MILWFVMSRNPDDQKQRRTDVALFSAQCLYLTPPSSFQLALCLIYLSKQKMNLVRKKKALKVFVRQYFDTQ